jgi:uncharacterized damage-inducible protein DinB
MTAQRYRPDYHPLRARRPTTGVIRRPPCPAIAAILIFPSARNEMSVIAHVLWRTPRITTVSADRKFTGLLALARGTRPVVTISGPKADLHSYLREAREALLWKLDGLSEYDARRPLTSTGTNLLGLVKHLTALEFGYFGDTFGRPSVDQPPWAGEAAYTADPMADMWATAAESGEYITGWYRRSWAHADATIEELGIDAVGRVPWWRPERAEVNLHRILTHMIAETHRHAGQADIIRELIDGAAGFLADNLNLPEQDTAWWEAYRDRVEQAARDAGERQRPEL